jgi:hypothetical protein
MILEESCKKRYYFAKYILSIYCNRRLNYLLLHFFLTFWHKQLSMIMNTFIRKFTLCLIACLLGCVTGHAYEQDNWYKILSIEADYDSNELRPVYYYKSNNSSEGKIYTTLGEWGNSLIAVYNEDGSLDRNISVAKSRYSIKDIVLDANGTIFIAEYYAVTCLDNDGTFKWRTGKYATETNYGSSGNEEGEFYQPLGIALGPNGKVYIADTSNNRVQVLNKNGTFDFEFGSAGSSPGQFSYPRDIEFFPDGKIAVADNNKIQIFDSNGTFINEIPNGRYFCAIDKGGSILTQKQSSSSSTLYCDINGNIIKDMYRFMHTYDSGSGYLSTVSGSNLKVCFTPKGDLITSFRISHGGYRRNTIEILRRTYRTKGPPVFNHVPQPSIRRVAQRAGTNVLDLDFEIIDSDDTHATVGIIAYCGNDKVVPQTWVDGTGSKINSPIATNQVHRVSWDVKQDWATSTGTIKFEILCQDGRTNKPVDLHFLTLPFPDGDMTISRSPLKDSDFQNYAKYLLAKGDAEFENESSNAVNYGGSQILTTSWGVTTACRTALLNALGADYRWATSAEVTKAREAATPGAVNDWTVSGQVKPRELPGSVNEYGFDVSTTIGYWVIKE